MRYRPFANTGLFVSELCLGTMTFGMGSTNPAWSAIGQLGPHEVERMLGTAIDAGINLLDTADVYSEWVPGNTGGDSEKIMGEWLASRGNREQFSCVYHNWSYNLRGELVSVAFKRGVRGKGGMPESFDNIWRY